MSILTQKTLANKINFSGIGIHTGVKVNMTVMPASPNSGIIFKRTDLNKNNIVVPLYNNVTGTNLCTTISNEYGVKVSTIEHLMGAFYGAGIDNAIIEIDSQETPILDGSAKCYIEAFKKVGLKLSDQPLKIIKINKKIVIEDNEKFISIEKSNVTSDIEFEIKYRNKIISTQKNKINVLENQLDDIFNSRTFCLYEDIEKLKKLDLGKGGSLDNAIVIKNNEILNKDGLRNKLEFVNHKILDCIGDLYTSGYRMIASVNCSQGGHYLTNSLLRKVFNNKDNFSIIEIQERTLPHTLINRSLLRSIA